MAECFGESGGDCHIAPNCRLRGVLGEAVTAFYAVLDRYTVEDLVNNRNQLARMLFIDSPAQTSKGARRPGSLA